MAYADEELNVLYEKTDGRCHVCRKKLAFTNYGVSGRRGAWEVDHSVPRARGGTDRRSNLLPACIPCNRSKQARSTRSARAARGHTRRPMSRAEQDKSQTKNALVGGGAGAVLGAMFAGPPGALVGGLVGALIGGSGEEH